MGGGGGVIGAIVGAVVTVVGVVTAQPQIIAMGVTMMASSIISAVTAPKPPTFDQNSQQLSTSTPGSNVQAPPATNNKLPVVYGNTFIGGTITDLSITSNNQDLYYVLSICEVTGNGTDPIAFGDIYYGGKKVVLDGVNVTGLVDVSTGNVDTSVAGLLKIYLYNNGSNSPVNSSTSAISVMQASGLTYQWDSTKLMTNTVFAIVHITYNVNASLTQIAQTQFQIINPRSNTGDVFFDYLTNEVYGAAIPASQIDSDSLNALTTYSNQTITFNNYLGVPSTQPRFKFNGAIDTTKSVMTNLQNMTQCCDCLLKYNEIYGKWAVIVQTPTTDTVMDINDSNIISSITITTLDISNTYNIAECQFPDVTLNSAFNTSTIDLSVVDPALLYPNEPQNSQTIQLPLVNNDVQAQLLATRFLKAARQDLQIQCTVAFQGIELEAGDIVSVTNANYGWTNKPFRALRVEQNFDPNAGITVSLLLQEYDAAVYNDASITQYQPNPNSGLPSPNTFGTIPAPTITNQLQNAAVPSFDVIVTTSSAGITQYAEIWYSAFANPTSSQRIFAGTTEIKASGDPYGNSVVCPNVTLSGIPSGKWYFFSRMVNSLGTSNFSPHSALLNWGPTTYQYDGRYLMVAYADSSTGGGFSLSPTGKTWYGLYNQNTSNPVSDPSLYTWFQADPVFGTNDFLLYVNRQNRKFSFATGGALFASQTGAYVPSDTSSYDQSLWSALPAGTNFIDLDVRTGQLLAVGTSSVSSSDGLIRVTNTQNGTVVAALERFLNFGAGVQYKTSPVANLTIDIYGRVVGFTSPDNFYYTETVFNASAGQTVFTLTHTVGNILVFKNGVLLGTSDYTETGTNFTMTHACLAGEKVVVLNMRATTTDVYYEPLNITIASITTNTITYASTTSPYQYINVGDLLCFSNSGTPTTYTVSAVNYSTRVITFTTTISGATSGLQVYQYRGAGTAYKPFSRYDVTLSNASDYTPTDWALRSGYEMIFVNGIAFNALDYNISAGTINGLPAPTTGTMTIIQFNENNLSVSCSNCANSLVTTLEGITEYAFANNPDAFELYANGVMQAKTYDFTDTSSLYTLLNIPDNSYTLLQQQTFARVGAA